MKIAVGVDAHKTTPQPDAIVLPIGPPDFLYAQPPALSGAETWCHRGLETAVLESFAMEERLGPYSISRTERVLRYNDRPVALAPKALDVLLVLVSDPGQVISKADLMERVWPESYVDEGNLTQNIYLLRKLFRQHQSGVTVQNIPKRGYRLIVQATVTSPARVLPAPFRTAVAAAVVAIAFAAVAAAITLIHVGNITSSRTLGGAALRAYLLGRVYQRQGSVSDLARSAALFARVIHSNPNNALGYAGLSEADASLSYYASDESKRAQLQADALTLGREAVRTDSNLAEADAALGAADHMGLLRALIDPKDPLNAELHAFIERRSV